MTRRERLRACAAWTLDWPDLPALALGSALAGYRAGGRLGRWPAVFSPDAVDAAWDRAGFRSIYAAVEQGGADAAAEATDAAR